MKQSNREKRLSRRIEDWARGQTNKDAGPNKRWSSGGYHKPGSNNK